jgi:Holliday junction DNA helicase RuvA
MRDRLPNLSSAESGQTKAGVASSIANNAKQEAISALIALGYKAQDAHKMVQNISADKSCEDIIRLALQGAR